MCCYVASPPPALDDPPLHCRRRRRRHRCRRSISNTDQINIALRAASIFRPVNPLKCARAFAYQMRRTNTVAFTQSTRDNHNTRIVSIFVPAARNCAAVLGRICAENSSPSTTHSYKPTPQHNHTLSPLTQLAQNGAGQTASERHEHNQKYTYICPLILSEQPHSGTAPHRITGA